MQTPTKFVKATYLKDEEFTDFQEFLESIDREPQGKWANDPGSKTHGKTFTGTDTYEEAVDLARDGWREGRERMAGKMMEALAAGKGPVGRSEMFSYDVAGVRPDVGAFCAGDPAHMLSLTNGAQVTDRVVRIFLDLSNNCNTDAELIENWGIGVAILVDSLENEGHSVEVTGFWELKPSGAGGNSKKKLRVTIPLKRAGEVLDLDRLAFMVGHPATLRRLLFRWLECQSDEIWGDYNWGYGQPVANGGVNGYGIPRGGAHNAVILPSAQVYKEEVKSLSDSIDTVAAVYNAQIAANKEEEE